MLTKKQLTGGLLGLLVAASLGCGAGTDTSDGTDSVPATQDAQPALRDVKLLSCAKDQFGGFTAKLTVTNNTADSQSYTIMVEAVDDKKTRLGEGHAVVNTLRSKQATNTDATGTLDTPGKAFTCNVVTVNRLPI